MLYFLLKNHLKYCIIQFLFSTPPLITACNFKLKLHFSRLMGVASFMQKRIRTFLFVVFGLGWGFYCCFVFCFLTAVLTTRIIWEILTSHLEGIVMIKQWSKDEIVYNLFWMCSWLCLTKENHDTDSKEKLMKPLFLLT